MNVKPGKGNLVTLNKTYSPGMDFLWLDLELALASKTSLLSLLPRLYQKPNAPICTIWPLSDLTSGQKSGPQCFLLSGADKPGDDRSRAAFPEELQEI